MSENKKDIAKNDAASKKSASSGKGSGKGNNFLSKVGKFFREYRSELKKISWPTFAEVLKNSAITLIVVLLLGAVIWLADWGISALRDTLIVASKPKEETSETITSESDVYQDLLEMLASDSDVSGSDQ